MAKALPLVALLLVGCLGPYGLEGPGESEFDSDPRGLLPDSPPIVVKIERIGLEGHVSQEAPTVVEFQLDNRGSARQVHLELHEWPVPIYNSWASSLVGGATTLTLQLRANDQSKHRWILPRVGYAHHMDPGAELLRVVRAEDDEVLGVGTMPDFKNADRHVAVIASSEDVGLDVQQSINRADMSQGGFSGRYSVALILQSPPDIWYEWDSTAAVILARPWSGLTAPEQTALSRHVVYGDTLHILPQYCDDWRSIPIAADAVPGDLPRYTGAGKIFVAQATSEDPSVSRSVWFTRTLPNWNNHRPAWNAMQPRLTLTYTMPDAALMIGIIALIIVLIGPVAHLVLIRLKKREMAWVVLPLLSLVLAGCMYVVASSVKGEESALETHHLVQNYVGTDHAVVTTGIRLQSASAGVLDLQVEAEHPYVSSNYFPHQMLGRGPGTITIKEQSFAATEIPMHRFSSQDFHFTAPATPVPIELAAPDPNSVTISNTSGAPYTNLYLKRPHGWVELADRLEAGATRSWKDLGPGVESHDLLEVEYDSVEAMNLSGLLGTASYRTDEFQTTFEATLLVAGCKASGLPAPKISPAPAFEKSQTFCAWFLPPAVPEPALPPTSGGVR